MRAVHGWETHSDVRRGVRVYEQPICLSCAVDCVLPVPHYRIAPRKVSPRPTIYRQNPGRVKFLSVNCRPQGEFSERGRSYNGETFYGVGDILIKERPIISVIISPGRRIFHERDILMWRQPALLLQVSRDVWWTAAGIISACPITPPHRASPPATSTTSSHSRSASRCCLATMDRTGRRRRRRQRFQTVVVAAFAASVLLVGRIQLSGTYQNSFLSIFTSHTVVISD